MSQFSDRKLLNLREAAVHLDSSVNGLLELLADNHFPLKYRDAATDSDWFIIDPKTIKKTFECGLTCIVLVTVNPKTKAKKDWKRTITFSQAMISMSDIAKWEKSYEPKQLKILTPDFRSVKFDGHVFKFSKKKAALFKVLYERAKSGDKTPLHQTKVFTAAKIEAEKGEDRLDILFRTTKSIKIIDNLILKAGLANYRLADFTES